MPTYQYVCTNPQCGNEFELVQSFTDPAASECPVCGQPVRKRYGSVGVVFKGSGFYRTDSRSESKSATTAASSSSSTASPSAASSSASSDSGPSSSSGSSKSDTAAKPATGSGSGSSGKVAATA